MEALLSTPAPPLDRPRPDAAVIQAAIDNDPVICGIIRRHQARESARVPKVKARQIAIYAERNLIFKEQAVLGQRLRKLGKKLKVLRQRAFVRVLSPGDKRKIEDRKRLVRAMQLKKWLRTQRIAFGQVLREM